MPYISVNTTKKVSPDCEKALKSALGEAITLFKGKTERWLMVEIQDSCRIWFQGNQDGDSAWLEVKLLGRADKEAFDAVTARLCEIMESVVGVPSDRVYVKYEEIDHWGWNGSNF